jgi:CheY-like chemotaxis protein
MEGRITVESELGLGSVFRITLPLPQVEMPPEQAEVETADEDISDLRVLIVDDIDMNRELLDLQVSTFGCRTQTASGGQQALQILESSEFDLLLLDCQMPGMDGYAVATNARARWPDRFLRIVAVTAHAQPGERSRCIGAGMDDLVPKPLSLQTVERVLRDSHAVATQLRGRRL